ncbi:MAG: alpha/beta hydrolase, partial [Acidobacteria bacterium]|nr:alpha/beta hydrolase [Acidobacteriota bacterium]
HPETRRKLSASTAVTMLKQALKQGFATSPEDEVLNGILAPYTTEVGKLSVIHDAAAHNTNLTTEISQLLPQLSAPTLILWGVDDVFQLVKYGERWARDIPDARLMRIKDARHFVTLDRPEEVAGHVSAFLGGQ